MVSQTTTKLKHDYRAKGLVAVYELIESELPLLEKALYSVKHTQDEMLLDNYHRGQIERINKHLELLKVLINDDPQ